MVAKRHPPIVKNLVCPDEAATQALAQTLAAAPGIKEAFITLRGDLGAGKTTLVRHLLAALGVQGRIKSPTYAVVEPHEAHTRQGLVPVFHFDFYRFNDPQEWEDAGFRDIFAGPGLKLAEWPQQADGLLPTPDLDVHLQVSNDVRHITLSAHTELGERLLEACS